MVKRTLEILDNIQKYGMHGPVRKKLGNRKNVDINGLNGRNFQKILLLDNMKKPILIKLKKL